MASLRNKIKISRNIGLTDQEWQKLVDQHMDFAYLVARRFLTTQEDIKDTIQAAFIKAWKSYQQFDPERSLFSTWFFTIIRNTAIDAQRKDGRSRTEALNADMHHEHMQAQQNPEDLYVDQELITNILTLAEELPLRQKECFILRDIEGLSLKEISKQTQQSEGSVKTSVYVARKKLRQWMIEKELM